MFFPPLVSAQVTPGPGLAGGLFLLGNQIRADAAAGGGNTDCGGNVFNTGLIAIGDASPQGTGNVKIFRIPVNTEAVLAPGFGNEAGTSDEIEIGVAFGPGNDVVGLRAPLFSGAGPTTIRLGTDGEHDYINLNAAETSGVDQDVSMEGVDRVVFEASDVPVRDDIRGIGGAASGDLPFPLILQADGQGGDDLIVGGNAADLFDGGRGADTMSGKNGDDSLFGKQQADRLFGSAGDDLFTGGGGGDLIYGGVARDQAYGEAGADTIRAGRGRDLLKGGDGPDVLVGGPGFDRCVGGAGNDSFAGCEKVSP
jgi:Ca2+-binding RTX toxin-like protein